MTDSRRDRNHKADTDAQEVTLGVMPKYHVERLADFEGKHDECRYFVLDPKHDPFARIALDRYADQAQAYGYKELALDIWGWLVEIDQERRADNG